MNILNQMETKVSSFTKSDRIIYEKLKKMPEQFIDQNINDIVGDLGVSPTAITRFAKKIGYAGFTEFQYQLAKDLQERDPSEEENQFHKYYEYLQAVAEMVDAEQLERISKIICSADRVYTMGYNLSRLAAQFLNNSLYSALSIDSVCLSYDDIYREYKENEVLILFSVSNGEFYQTLLKNIHKHSVGVHVILVTMNPKHLLRKYSEEIVLLPSADGVQKWHTAVLESIVFTAFTDLLMDTLTNEYKKQ